MAKLTPVVLDYETFWDTDHSLSKMSAMKYVMHPKTEIISVAAKFGNGHTDVIFGEDRIVNALRKIDWSDKYLISHNNEGFDSMVSAWRVGIKPAMWGCTLAMARPIHAKTIGLSLAKLVEHYRLGVKDNAALINTRGKHLKDFTPAEIEAMREYNRDDTEQCAGLFKALVRQTTPDELRLIDLTIRMLVEPQFALNKELLLAALAAERENKAQALRAVVAHFAKDNPQWAALELDEDAGTEEVRALLASAAKFSNFLRERGVDVPTKTSKTTGKPTPALAKTDEEFLALQQHRDPLVAAAARARLGVKSTLLETRIEAFIEASGAVGGRLPIPIKYAGADTTQRWSGWAYNPQNLPRIIPAKPKTSDALRMSLCAPPGNKVVVADLSGIELRVNMFLWKVRYAMELFQNSPDKADLYRYFAAHELYRILEEEVNKEQRQIGKISHLGLGFGAAATTFQKVAKIMGGIDMSLEEAAAVVRTYREAHPEIAHPKTGGWKLCHGALDYIHAGQSGFEIDPWGMCTTTPEGIKTPKGMIRYPNLRKERNDEGRVEWVYGEGRHKARIYAGKITENIVQHLARCVIADNMNKIVRTEIMREIAKINDTALHHPALTVHDELVYVVPDDMAVEALDTIQSIMRTPPEWWPELVVWSEGDIADNYGEAK